MARPQSARGGNKKTGVLGVPVIWTSVSLEYAPCCHLLPMGADGVLVEQMKPTLPNTGKEDQVCPSFLWEKNTHVGFVAYPQVPRVLEILSCKGVHLLHGLRDFQIAPPSNRLGGFEAAPATPRIAPLRRSTPNTKSSGLVDQGTTHRSPRHARVESL